VMNRVVWATGFPGRASDLQKPTPIIPKGSLSEWAEEGNQGTTG